MFSKKRLRGLARGFRERPKAMRTAEEINRDYNEQAVQIGHKMRIMSELEDQILGHKEALIRLSAEAQALPKEEKQPKAQIPQVQAQPEMQAQGSAP